MYPTIAASFLTPVTDVRHVRMKETELFWRLRVVFGYAFVQIAGLIARRIICYPVIGDVLKKGERYGLIRFGSRLDVYLPLDVVPLVKLGDVVVAGETVLGHIGQVRTVAHEP